MSYVQFSIQKILDLCSIPSPTGFTHRAIKYLVEEFKKLGFSYTLTKKNNLLVDLGHGESDAIMFVAHVDTLGAMVKHIKNNGRLSISKIGSFPFNHVENENCIIHTRDGKEYTGTIYLTKPSVHVYKEVGTLERNDENIEVVLDQKVSNEQDVKDLGIMPGDYISFEPRTILTKTGFIKSRHLDDKAGVGILLGLAKSIRDYAVQPKRKVYMMFTSYEEVGHGAASSIPEDVSEVISVDMGAVGEGLNSNVYSVSICAKDSGGPYDYETVSKLIKAANIAEVNYTVDIYPYYGSDVESSLRAGYDIRHGLIGPGVYASHGYERTHIDAIEATLKLLQVYVEIDE
ncbi:MAG: aminopeptidase [Thermosipho sp. (in: thermotogales)]|nr:aminopeptidase [Thermosipho sp. (in: thermotogales)]MDN5324815.1 aminopeptidase [Thermosipho sp. (in: thermotogales)]